MANKKPPRVGGTASGIFVVQLPDTETQYNAHVKRIDKLLTDAGYVVVPMTGEFILEMADNIKEQMAEVEQAQTLLVHAAAGNPDLKTESKDD